MIDSHIHLDDKRFDFERSDLIKTAQRVGVSHFIVPAVCVDRFYDLKNLQEQWPCVSVAYGLHPYWVAQHEEKDVELLDQWLCHERAVAVGECGLDYVMKGLDRAKQMYFLEHQILLAKKHNLPLILHVRGAVEAVFMMLRKYNYYRAVMHSFNGSAEQARQITEKGVFLGFGGVITYDRATRIRCLVKKIPLRYMMVETDAPDQPVVSAEGRVNRPEYLLKVVEAISYLKGVSFKKVVEATSHNCKELFKL